MRPRVLRSRVAAALLRAAAVVAVACGSSQRARAQGDTRPTPAPTEPPAERGAATALVPPERVPLDPTPPAGLDFAASGALQAARATGRLEAASRPVEQLRPGAFVRLYDAVCRLPDDLALKRLLTVDLTHERANSAEFRVPPRELMSALREAESRGLFEASLTAWAWRSAELAAPGQDLADLYAALHAHARATDALVLYAAAERRVGSPRWQSKAGPPPFPRLAAESRPVDGSAAAPTSAGRAVARIYATRDAGTWDSEGRLFVRVAGGGGRLFRRGGSFPLTAGETVDVRRLDVVVADAAGLAFETSRCGALRLGPGATLVSRNAAGFLEPEGRVRIAALVAEALADGPEAEAAAAALERIAPLAADEMRAAVMRRPDAPGAPRLRLLLALYDA